MYIELFPLKHSTNILDVSGLKTQILAYHYYAYCYFYHYHYL